MQFSTAALLAPILAAAIIAGPVCMPASARGERYVWGALAADPQDADRAGSAILAESQAAATEIALEACGDRCAVVLVFKNQCGAYAVGPSGAAAAGLGSSRYAAQTNALRNCRAKSGTCRIAVQACSRAAESFDEPASGRGEDGIDKR